jgi:hypothetical protein
MARKSPEFIKEKWNHTNSCPLLILLSRVPLARDLDVCATTDTDRPVREETPLSSLGQLPKDLIEEFGRRRTAMGR